MTAPKPSGNPLATRAAGPATPGPGALHPLGLDHVRLDDGGLLGQWRRRNAGQTLPHCIERLESSGNLGNLRAAAGETGEEFAGMWFADSDVHKTLEAALWELAAPSADPGLRELAAPSADPGLEDVAGDPGLRKFVDDTVALLARAQHPDGYLNSYFTLAEPDQRWLKPVWSHELYCAGHLIQAAVAAGRTGACPELVAVARHFADLLVERFSQVEEVCGHPEIETALAELYRLTGHHPYLDLARRFLDLRGRGLLERGRFGPRYHQDHVPPREAREVTGHSVRQLYLLAGMVDVAVETGDEALMAASRRLWDDAIGTRTYVTGAHGSRHRDEAYGDPYELPADRAYAETCASIAAFHVSWRLLLATGEARYADEMERVLHNAVAAAVSEDGRHFFYSNPLHLRTGHTNAGEESAGHRLPWYSCACCPPNIARLMASLPAYLATGDASGLQLHLYAAATIEAGPATVRVRTDYPWQGRVELTVSAPEEWTLALRVPSWCSSFSVLIDGEPARASVDAGYLRLSRAWGEGTSVVLDLGMPVRQVRPHPRVDAVRGCVALARGPLVYCLEQHDLPDGVVLEDVRLDGDAPLRPTGTAPVVITASGKALDVTNVPLHTTDRRPTGAAPLQLTAVPYFLWGNRSQGPMRVWLPTTGTP
ncbi:glycoside hydrolase family 127 protein [Nonomuraea sp. PA05]|uniref:glycoside hydrolase family 127 protein n=1 Tax=Nonomuraea sp. PA05 TaxID=2604466 RepID=UPI0016527654|nr:beta-L-arabinofuranosidase domain-containing protein [Nonomuraea sp. PA05]